MRKKVLIVALSILIIIPTNAKATTLRDYENKVTKYQNELNAAKAAIKKTESQIASTKTEISNIKKESSDLEEEIEHMHDEVDNGNEEIKKKSLEIKDFYAYYQMSDGENAYLEYAFQADNMTDFIYRMAVVEQMTEYNNQVIKELQQMIERNKKREVEIGKKQVSLDAKKKVMEGKVVSLGEQKESLQEGGVDSQKQLKIYQDIVASYKKQGCKSNDVIGVDCAKTGSAGIFRRPTKVGMITSEFGSRWGSLHRGVDISSPNKKKEKIYPVANGTITAKYHDTNGALVLMIEHYDSKSKKWYTSDYCHMSSYAPGLYVGKYVTSDQYIGYMGNTGYVLPRPTKAKPDNGTHLHMEIAQCRVYKDSKCGTWSKYTSFMASQARNGFKGPRALINFPKSGTKWTSR